jgi:hypothetical protein
MVENQLAQIQTAAADETQRNIIHQMLSELLITVTDQLFEKRVIYIDGYRFINCRFVDCTVKTLRGTFELHHCVIAGGSINYNADALKSIQLFRSGGAAPAPEVAPKFNGKKYPDGSLSIAKGASF